MPCQTQLNLEKDKILTDKNVSVIHLDALVLSKSISNLNAMSLQILVLVILNVY